jgi:hypothetical protein
LILDSVEREIDNMIERLFSSKLLRDNREENDFFFASRNRIPGSSISPVLALDQP